MLLGGARIGAEIKEPLLAPEKVDRALVVNLRVPGK
jgi:hypothetical protein